MAAAAPKGEVDQGPRLSPLVHDLFGIEGFVGFEENHQVPYSYQKRESAVPARRMVAIGLIMLGCASAAVAKDMALVANKANMVTAVTMPELVKICKGQTSRWGDGKPVTFITRNPASPDMKMVLEKVYGMSKEETAAMITAANHGRTNHPAIVVVESDEDLVNKVQSIPGAVGLVDVYSINGGVAVVRLGGKLPLEQGYPLHGN